MSNAKALNPDEVWEKMDHNKELRKLLDDTQQVDLIRDADMASKEKYDQIDKCVSLLDKMRRAMREIRKSMG